MIQIGDIIVSRELLTNHFVCNLEKCYGNCCVYGDSGAPLEDGEADLITSHLHDIYPYMRQEGIRTVAEKGAWVIDNDGDKVTPLVGWEECAYVIFEGDIARCAIEKAYKEGAIPFRKPVSCHLYPIRVNKMKNGIALNYHQWSVCEPARILGKERGVPVFRFLKDPLIRVFGEPFYEELELVYREMKQSEIIT
ncbi:MAG: DUF3109 family protein [Bacteroidales bacterium]|nr:DUF3109 family protein [Bacteroidales bacterium]MBN2697184.1 DUF3109 family protein [Bacteroidales bacterium]